MNREVRARDRTLSTPHRFGNWNHLSLEIIISVSHNSPPPFLIHFIDVGCSSTQQHEQNQQRGAGEQITGERRTSSATALLDEAADRKPCPEA